MKPKRQEYHGRRIEVLEREKTLELLIDDVPVEYGQLPDGKYFLNDYAYDWSDDLTELARRYIDHQGRVEKAQSKQSTQKER